MKLLAQISNSIWALISKFEYLTSATDCNFLEGLISLTPWHFGLPYVIPLATGFFLLPRLTRTRYTTNPYKQNNLKKIKAQWTKKKLVWQRFIAKNWIKLNSLQATYIINNIRHLIWTWTAIKSCNASVKPLVEEKSWNEYVKQRFIA